MYKSSCSLHVKFIDRPQTGRRVLRAAVTAQRVSVMDLLYIGSIDLLPARFLFQNIFILKMYKQHQILSGIRIYIQQACFRGFLISLSRWKIYPSLV